ncbi:hypothetical protein RJT34_20023 [Clitoria ternatea]|uniref:Glutamyl-tRNA reductase N-terminal domain-containing protein n=1 Tax=Clitoria ternatea TaxID=43366 RepID=A0AAN9P4E8_CLITE
MGNANGQEDRAISGAFDPSVAEASVRVAHAPNSRSPVRAFSSDSMANSPPHSPCHSRSSILFGPQVSGVPIPELCKHQILLYNKDATQHLFRVAARLDSLVLGEGQIPQVKQVVKTGINEAFGIACLNNPPMGQERWGIL